MLWSKDRIYTMPWFTSLENVSVFLLTVLRLGIQPVNMSVNQTRREIEGVAIPEVFPRN